MGTIRKKFGLAWSLSDSDFETEVAVAETLSELATAIGGGTGGTLRAIKKRIEILGLDVSHYRTRGQRPEKHQIGQIPVEEVLVENSPYSGKAARLALLRFKSVPYVCNKCPQGPEWNGEPLVLNLDHIDGDSKNHSPKNLRWLCPNCHSQTETFCGRNHKNPKRRSRNKNTGR